MNLPLARSMENGINAGRFEKKKGFCLRACRQGAEPVHGLKYDRLFRGDGSAFPHMSPQEARERDATAARAGHRFLAAGLAFKRSELKARGGLQPGDMIVKTEVARNRWGDFSGHIGTVCEDVKRIGENSSTSIGRVHGALGFRTIEQFGDFQIVIRLEPPKVILPKPVSVAKPTIAAPRFTINGDPLKTAFIHNDRLCAPVVDTLNVYGLETHADVTARGGNVQAWPKPE